MRRVEDEIKGVIPPDYNLEGLSFITVVFKSPAQMLPGEEVVPAGALIFSQRWGLFPGYQGVICG